MSKFQFPVVDAQAHIGRFPGHVYFRYSAEEFG